MTDMWLVVGLGNPGPTYTHTRHNVGYLVVDELARRARVALKSVPKMRADVAETRIGPLGLGVPGAGAVRLALVRSHTYMNDSGLAVGRLAAFYGVTPGEIVAVHDELDLDLGQLRLKKGGGDNGHNGLKSMRAHLHSGDFLRVRFGIGRPPGRQAPADYVLAPIPTGQREAVAVEVARAADAVEMLLTEGLSAAQNRYNS
ncbi:aminoacyl-tRNA hydrolase [Raineyella sp. W15-4]|uniref:aminoacyl-tRNA hydrolase n=1 Tax=Raineyella sp. W15-4 TaxID=3081651 RepID=UPI0029529BCB|nr:aminoacyl-tRNA hydrolase [Raineyella sp. W15-4]WOQ18961.1 aminoacyl-tRNA hydrolase [Raineyella sp. W15-4]